MADLPVQDDLIHFASAHRIAGFERYYEELIKALEPCHPLGSWALSRTCIRHTERMIAKVPKGGRPRRSFASFALSINDSFVSLLI